MEEIKTWIFTFGYGHKHPNTYVEIKGTHSSSRKKMFDRYGNKWSFQYPEEKREKLESSNIKKLGE